MCGIAGLIHKNGPMAKAIISRMILCLSKRGPDDEGVLVEKNVGLAHRRLSIIDLSPAGHQPFVDKTTGDVITYNGEIYNFRELRQLLLHAGHQFSSGSDTEVVLKAYQQWGISALDKLNGMFAFAIWDRKRNAVFIARDRVGIKPLYYFCNHQELAFASRLSALLQHPSCPSSISPQALSFYFRLGFVPAPYTILEGVHKLEPGCYLWVGLDDLTKDFKPAVKSYWSLSDFHIDQALRNEKHENLVERLDGILAEAIDRTLIADVPVGILLSGGIDSSLVAAFASKTTPSLKAFTIGFDDAQFDELDYAKKIAAHLGLEHHHLMMKSHDLVSYLDAFIGNYDEPFADSSAFPTMAVSELARQEVKVALCGDGGDELFAGYPIYRHLRKLKLLFLLPSSLRKRIGMTLQRQPVRKIQLLGGAISSQDLMSSFIFMRSISKNLQHPIMDDITYRLEDFFVQDTNDYRNDAVYASTKLDMKYYMSDGLLQKVDVASMAFGLEARVPLLDRHVVEFSLALPTHYKLNGASNKFLLKEVLAKYLPASFFDRPKHGFSIPLARWIRTDLRELLERQLSEENLSQIMYLDSKKISRLLQLHFSEKCDASRLLWAVFCYVNWYQRHFIQINKA